MSRPIQALIDLSALEYNLSVVRRHAPNSRVMAVIKADAYGHGLLRAAEALARAEGFAMLELDAAVRLREAGYRQTILLLEGFFDISELGWIEQYHLSTVIHHREQLAMLSASRPRGKLDVFLKLNTGMNRLGFTLDEFPAALETLKANSAVGQITADDAFCPRRRALQKREHRRAATTFQRCRRRAVSAPFNGQFRCYPAFSRNTCRLGTAGHHALWRLSIRRHRG